MKNASMVVLAVLAAGTAVSARSAVRPPRIVCDKPLYDFGKVDNTRRQQHEFTIRNEGDLPLEIKRVRASCGCTVAKLASNTIPPGGDTTVTMQFILTGRKGPQRKYVTVESNDPKQPRLTLVMAGTAMSELDVVPPRIYFGRVPFDAPVSKTVDISASKETINIVRTESTVEHVMVNVETVEPGKSYRARVDVKAPMPQGILRATVTLHTDSKKYPIITIPVTGSVVGELDVAPERIILLGRGNQPVTRYVVVRPGHTKRFAIEKVEVPDPEIRVQVDPLGAGGSLGYRILVRNIVPSMNLDEKSLRISTNVKAMAEIEVPFEYLERPAPAAASPKGGEKGGDTRPPASREPA